MKDLRCFKGEHAYDFSKHINLFVGANNSGKSTLMKALHLPETASQPRNCVRMKSKEAVVELQFADVDERLAKALEIRDVASDGVRFRFIDNHNISRSVKSANAADWGAPARLNFRNAVSHKDNLFHPFFSRRKAATYEEQTNEKTEQEIRTNLSNIQQRLIFLSNADSDYHERFQEACLNIIGHPINTITLAGGTGAGILVDEDNKIPLTDMGEGVPNVLGLLVDLFSDRKGRIFLIEELENDLHPKALKQLLDLIVEHSDRHQFFISTHSSIVLRHLGLQENTVTFTFTSKPEGKIPTSEVQRCHKDMQSLGKIAESLGSTPLDSFLFDGYLILEESSAQSIIDSILIEHFTPKLKGRLKAISANGVANVPNLHGSAQSMFLMNHLSPAYEQRCWVMVDGGKEGAKVIANITHSFPKKTRFLKELSEHNLERYYPPRFGQEADEALAAKDDKQKHKANLLHKVLHWAKEHPEEAISEFKDSAREIIDILKEIDRCLEPLKPEPSA